MTEVTIDPELADLVPGYLENRRRDVLRVGEALQASDFDQIRTLAHSMRGSGGGYGFDEISRIGRDMEEAALAIDAGAVAAALARLREYLAAVKVVVGEAP